MSPCEDMDNWQQVFRNYAKKRRNYHEFSWAVAALKLFPPWACKWWCWRIWHAQMAPIHIIEQSPFCSFFFRPTSREPHVTTLYMHIWCGVHMAYYLRHRDVDAVHAFMAIEGLPDAFHEALRAIPVCLRGQGDWKCEKCGPMPGTSHVCRRCHSPMATWRKYVI